jgi:hypothetical protein
MRKDNGSVVGEKGLKLVAGFLIQTMLMQELFD